MIVPKANVDVAEIGKLGGWVDIKQIEGQLSLFDVNEKTSA